MYFRKTFQSISTSGNLSTLNVCCTIYFLPRTNSHLPRTPCADIDIQRVQSTTGGARTSADRGWFAESTNELTS